MWNLQTKKEIVYWLEVDHHNLLESSIPCVFLQTKFIGVRAILGVRSRVFQEMLYGIQTGFGSPQVPVAELLARPVPTLLSPQQSRPKTSNFLQVPDIESPRPKSVPSSPMVKRAFSRLGTITAGWGRSIRKSNAQQLSADDKKKWASSQDCSSEFHSLSFTQLAKRSK